MRKIIRTTGVLAGLALGLLAGGLPAHAAPAGTGWDNNPDVVVSGGSDTTYLVSQRLSTLYNGDPGCTVNTSGTSSSKGKCATPADTTPANGNFDHDVFTDAQPTGSGAGINSLLSNGVAYNPAINFARSSRGVGSQQEKNELSFFGYARDAIAVVTFGTRTGAALSKQDLKDIYQCNKTNWNQFNDVNGAPLAAGTIQPWDMNSASGTRATFVAYLDGITFGSCVVKLNAPAPTGTAPFENDVKPLLADTATNGTRTDGRTLDPNNYLWWMSFADWQKYPYTRNAGTGANNAGAAVNSNLVQVDGVDASNATLNDGTYTITRFIYAVTKATDADCLNADNSVTNGIVNGTTCPAAGPSLSGASGGAGGAIRQYMEWLCRTSDTQHQKDPVTGVGYRTEIVKAFNAEGFQQVQSADRTSGYSCAIFTG